jgi:hypothetical protein
MLRTRRYEIHLSSAIACARYVTAHARHHKQRRGSSFGESRSAFFLTRARLRWADFLEHLARCLNYVGLEAEEGAFLSCALEDLRSSCHYNEILFFVMAGNLRSLV